MQPPSNPFRHIRPHILTPTVRVAFSVQNMTGQSIRYLQFKVVRDKYSIEYLAPGQRSMLSFVAAHTILRQGRVFETPFDSQREVHSIEGGG